MTRRYLAIIVAAGVLLALPGAVLAASPVALATSVSGKMTPTVEMFTELEAKTKITLAADAEIEFLHYASCQTVLVRGGILSFTAERYLLRRGRVVSTKRAKCPKAIAPKGASQIGGLVLRSASSRKLRVATTPSFVLVGKDAQKVESISVSQDGAKIVEAANPGRSFHWPDDAPQLKKDRDYLVTLKLAGEAEPKTFSVQVRGRGGKGAITLIRLD